MLQQQPHFGRDWPDEEPDFEDSPQLRAYRALHARLTVLVWGLVIFGFSQVNVLILLWRILARTH